MSPSGGVAQPVITPGLAAALRTYCDRECRWAVLAARDGWVGWNGSTDWRDQIGEIDTAVMREAEAAGIWSPPDETSIDASGDDPLRAARAPA